MRAGRMRQRIMIQRATETTDSYGQTMLTWAPHKAMWSMLEFDAASEQREGERQQGVRSGTATMRYLEDVTAKDRFVFDGRTFEIIGVINVDRRRGETILRFRETA